MSRKPELQVCPECEKLAKYAISSQETHRVKRIKCDEHKRRDLNSDYEEIYLRYNTLEKYLPKADPAIFNSPDFKRVISFKAGVYWSLMDKVFRANGFEFCDVESVVMTWSYAFSGLKNGQKPSRRLFNEMMKFLDQRFEGWTKWTWKKFHMSERIGNVPLEDQDFRELHIEKYISESNPMNYGSPFDSQESRFEFLESDARKAASPLLMEQICEMKSVKIHGDRGAEADLIKLQLQDMKGRVIELKGFHSPQINKERRAIVKRIRTLRSAADDIGRERMREIRRFKQMKKTFDADPLKFSEQLCYYASIKHVSFDVRKKAQLICKKYGIDYISWAKKQIEDKNVPSSNFDVRINCEQ